MDSAELITPSEVEGPRAGHATIVAPATAAARSGVGILRISGPAALSLALPLAPDVPAAPQPRHAYLSRLVNRAGAPLDEGLFLWFRAPHSFTGEDVVELQAHGSPAVLSLLQSALLEGSMARLAEPGEFSRRAFVNGRMDLTRAEAVADLVRADSEAAVHAAAAAMHGDLSARVRALREEVLAVQADLEAALEFSPEDVGSVLDPGERLERLAASCEALRVDLARAQLLRRGVRAVLFGPANAGKSTLFNALVGEARALVDAEPGTTRDAVEASAELDGIRVTWVDTAGLSPSPGRVEALGIARSREAMKTADLVLAVVPPDCSAQEQARMTAELQGKAVLWVLSKCDLGLRSAQAPGAVSVSARSGEGMAALRGWLAQWLRSGAPDAVGAEQDRQRDAAERARASVQRASAAWETGAPEAASGELGWGLQALGELTGETASTELLDAVFRRFCIGK